MERSAGDGAVLRTTHRKHEDEGNTAQRATKEGHTDGDGAWGPGASASRRLTSFAAIAAAIAAVGAIASGPHLAAIGSFGTAPTPGAGPRPTGAAAAARAAAPGSVTEPAPAATLLVEELRATWRLTGGLEEAAALGVIVARRRALAGRAPGTDDPVFAVLEAIERPAGDAVVVTVLVDVGPVGVAAGGAPAPDAAGMGGPPGAGTQIVRVAVPLVVGDDGPQLAGEPWTLPAPRLAVLAPAATPLDDARLVASARLALVRAGLAPDEDPELGRTSSWPVIATATIDGRPHDVWLRWHLDRFVVAGLPLDRGSARTDTDAAVVR